MIRTILLFVAFLMTFNSYSDEIDEHSEEAIIEQEYEFIDDSLITEEQHDDDQAVEEECLYADIEKIDIEFDVAAIEETITIEAPVEQPKSIRFKSSHEWETVSDGTKITLTASTQGFGDDIEIVLEYSDDNGKTAHEFAKGKTCTIIASLENKHRLYRAVVRQIVID